MNNFELEIDLKNLNNTLTKISDNFTKIDEIINDVNDAYNFLDETKWQGKDKTKIDGSYGEYFKNMSKFSNDLNDTIKVLQTGVFKYEDVEKNIVKDLKNMEDK